MTRAAIKHEEEQLRGAMLAGDVGALERLFHDELLLVGPTGALARKDEELEAYRSGRQRLVRIATRELVVELHGPDVGVVSVIAELEGSHDGIPFTGAHRYLRTWRRESGLWQVVACSVVRVA
jgi:ketosteroid isomerase-like protein